MEWKLLSGRPLLNIQKLKATGNHTQQLNIRCCRKSFKKMKYIFQGYGLVYQTFTWRHTRKNLYSSSSCGNLSLKRENIVTHHFTKNLFFLVGTTNNSELGGPRTSWIDNILLPHLCIVCFITFLAIYQGKFGLGKFLPGGLTFWWHPLECAGEIFNLTHPKIY